MLKILKICLWKSSLRLLKSLSLKLLNMSKTMIIGIWYLLYLIWMKRKTRQKSSLCKAIISILLGTWKQITMIVLSFLTSQRDQWSSKIITCCLRKVSMANSKLFQATLEILSLRRVISNDLNRLYNSNKINNKLKVWSKQHKGKFRKREDCMLQG